MEQLIHNLGTKLNLTDQQEQLISGQSLACPGVPYGIRQILEPFLGLSGHPVLLHHCCGLRSLQEPFP